MANFGKRLLDAFGGYGQLCVGIDPSQEQLSSWGLDFTAGSAEKFSKTLVEACFDRVGIIKPQVAFFEQFGSEGFAVLEEICDNATKAGLLVIADGKRGDIGSSMDGYANAWLAKDAPFVVDALTLSPYLGPNSLESIISQAADNSKGVFILAATSNPEAKDFQSSKLGQSTLVEQVFEFASKYAAEGLSNVGLVIGATVDASKIVSQEKVLSLPILAPGFGFQGAKLADVSEIFGKLSGQVICNVGRSVAGDSADGLVERVESAKAELLVGLRGES